MSANSRKMAVKSDNLTGVSKIIEFVNRYLLGVAVPAQLIIMGIYFGFRLGWFHILHPIRTVRYALSGDRKKAFSALTLALAGTLGVGNMVGVASALALGGCGAVFWMWVSAAFAMILKYSEITLSIRHRAYEANGAARGGAMYYVRDIFALRGANKIGKLLSVLFALLFVLCALTMGSILQSRAVSDALRVSFSLPTSVGSAILSALTLLVCAFGKRGVMRATEKIVPLMTLAILILSGAVLFLRAEEIPAAFTRIFKEAFALRAAGGGILGFLLSDTLRLGAMRGLISNEAGCGTSPTAHAESEPSCAARQGIWGIFEVFVDTILLCTVTALVIIVSGVPLDASDLMGVTLRAYSSVLGAASEYVVSLSIFCFGFATVICWSHYGAEGVYYLCPRPAARRAFTALFAVAVFLGGIFSADTAWQTADLAVGAMTVINLFVLLLGEREIAEETESLS